jgi:pseudouridine-5'-phosphate glycosidase
VTVPLQLSPEVTRALEAGDGVVALETTLIAHGFPAGEGVVVGEASEAAVRASGAVPATIGVLEGEVCVGLDATTLATFDQAGSAARKLGPRDLAACVVQRALGATTVGGTLAVCAAAGISVMATGGLGGVHRGFAVRPDISADLGELARTRAIVVCSGVKSLLDVPATCELLETLGVPVLGYRTGELPLFYASRGGPPVSARVESADEAAAIALAHWRLGRTTAVVLARPPDESLDDAEPLIEEALILAEASGVRGQGVTPFVLAHLHEASGGRTLRANHDLVVGNARLAGEVAVALAALSS